MPEFLLLKLFLGLVAVLCASVVVHDALAGWREDRR
jgi:hypothetical protein